MSLESEKLPGLTRGTLNIVDLSRSDEGTYACLTEDADGTRTDTAKVEVFVGKKKGNVD